MLDEYERKLLEGWEEVSKRGQLTLWIFLALKDGSKHMTAIKDFVAKATKDLVIADDKSMYRALRRFEKSDMLESSSRPNKNGPDLKVYRLTPLGGRILEAYLQRNVRDLFLTNDFKKLITK